MKKSCDLHKFPEVSVLMSTYNGEQYLAEQIESILTQSYPNIKLIVRDDGSSDNTLNILNNYSNRIHILAESNVGCKSSFLKVAQYADQYLPESRYFAFSDQDDYWLSDKIEKAITKLKQYDNLNIPLLYICHAKLVDKDLKPIESHKKNDFKYTLGEAMMMGTCAGCTMVFNRVLLNLFVRAKPEYMFLHDDWIYKLCLACNGKLIVDDKIHILYRQHGNNSIGGNQNKFKAWKRRFKMFTHGSVRSSKANALLELYPDVISEEAKKILLDVSNYKKSLRSKLRILLSKQFRTSNLLFNAIFKAAVVFNKY